MILICIIVCNVVTDIRISYGKIIRPLIMLMYLTAIVHVYIW